MRQLVASLNLDTETMLGKRAWSLACPSINTMEELALLGICIYAANTVTARLRHASQLVLDEADALQALRQCVKESAKGHGPAIKILKEAWMADKQNSEIPKLHVRTSKMLVATPCKNQKAKGAS